MRRARDEGGHADEGVGGLGRARDVEERGGLADRRAEHGAEEERRAEDAARASRAEGDAGREELDAEERDEEDLDRLALHERVDRLVAVAEEARGELDRERADAQAADRGLEPLRQADLLEEGRPEPDPAREEHGAAAADQPQDGVDHELVRVLEPVLRHRDDRVVAEDRAADDRRRDRRDDDGPERVHGEAADDHLEGEESSAERSVEDRREAGGRAARGEHLELAGSHSEELPDARGNRGADLDHGTFAAERAARAEGDGARDRLDHGDHGRDPAAALVDRADDGGHSVSLGLAREEVNDRPDDETAERGGDEDPPPRVARALDQLERPLVLLRPEGEELNPPDEVVEGNRAQPREHSRERGEEEQPRRLGDPQPAAQRLDAAVESGEPAGARSLARGRRRPGDATCLERARHHGLDRRHGCLRNYLCQRSLPLDRASRYHGSR